MGGGGSVVPRCCSASRGDRQASRMENSFPCGPAPAPGTTRAAHLSPSRLNLLPVRCRPLTLNLTSKLGRLRPRSVECTVSLVGVAGYTTTTRSSAPRLAAGDDEIWISLWCATSEDLSVEHVRRESGSLASLRPLKFKTTK